MATVCTIVRLAGGVVEPPVFWYTVRAPGPPHNCVPSPVQVEEQEAAEIVLPRLTDVDDPQKHW